MGTRENKIETYLKDRIEDIGGITRKWVSPGHDGVPDQIVIVRHNTSFVEVKTTDGSLSMAQCREHTRLRKCGACVTTVYGHKGVDKLVDDVKMFSRPMVHYYG